ncbi:MAG: NAD(P)(+) transhydrogenase (Re/Si-specific) subunit beta [Myxococcales bacterium]|nr:NAD(P)(+) transhydrogenase (Re/Si-specific) subunit beta [Myxococcales bacterium]MCB9541868.1 NAD(P)(+) transhydrogenase (Re/Si-specific) subunit beta [Myxococcales bacterium]
MELTLLIVAYLVSSVLFILSLRGLSSQETARRGNVYGIIGMAIAVGATLTMSSVTLYAVLAPALVIGAGIGYLMAARVAMTAMPELVALLHSFVGAAAVLVGFATWLDPRMHVGGAVFLVEVFIDVFIGAITFTGSVVAFLKLKGQVSGSPLLLPGRHLINLAMLAAAIVLGVLYVRAGNPFEGGAELASSGLVWLVAMAVIAGVLGVHLVMAIGGADMPVVVSMLNSYSGWTASAAGFMLSNDLLIVTGALVGSSGAILSYIMCRAMNRSIWNVIFGGFGTTSGAAPKAAAEGEPGEVQEITVEGTVAELLAAKEVVIVPGYGMAVARAQHQVCELTQLLRERGKTVRFAIHPVAGRLPGHMNVLLAEANVPYDIVLEMDEINDDLPKTDVVLVIGANDIVNPIALEEGSPISGMPVLEVWEARRTIISKRSRASGYAGVDNPLFYHERSRMLFGDAGQTVGELVGALRARGKA